MTVGLLRQFTDSLAMASGYTSPADEIGDTRSVLLAWPRHAPLAPHAHQIRPAQIHTDRTTQFGAHPRCHRAANPVLALGRRAPDRRSQLGHLLGRERRRGPMGVGGSPIDHTGWPLGVVALGDLANPVARVAGARGDLPRQLPVRQKPENLSPTALVRFPGCPVAQRELVHRQMRGQANASCHAIKLQHPSSNSYDTSLGGRSVRRRPVERQLALSAKCRYS
jgi:hypothetical protein